jgi:hypothetical protein
VDPVWNDTGFDAATCDECHGWPPPDHSTADCGICHGYTVDGPAPVLLPGTTYHMDGCADSPDDETPSGNAPCP